MLKYFYLGTVTVRFGFCDFCSFGFGFGRNQKFVIHQYTLFSFRKLTEEKSKEKEELVDAVKKVRDHTNEQINGMHNAVDEKIQSMAWNSHAR